jgi:hypothetical protein
MPVSNCMAAGAETDAQFEPRGQVINLTKTCDLIQFVTSIKGTVDKAVDGVNYTGDKFFDNGARVMHESLTKSKL